MSSSPNPAGANRQNVRSAALAAAEARLRPPPSYDAVAATQSGSGEGLADSPAVGVAGDSSGGSGTGSGSGHGARAESLIAQARAAHLARQSGSGSASPSGGGTGAGINSSGSGAPWRQTEKEDRELRIKFGRLLDRGIVRDNGYKQSAEAVETLLKIATNIMTTNDPKFRTLKATNTTLKTKVLDAKGGHDYLIALGFRTQKIAFALQYVFTASLKRMHELELGAEVLKDHLKALQERVEITSKSVVYGASAEAARRAAALAEIEADRDTVRARVTRERIVREAREKKEREAKERELAQEAEEAVDRHDEDAREMREAVVRDRRMVSGQTRDQDQDEPDDDDEEMGTAEAESNEPEDEGEEEEEDPELPSYMEDRESRRWGGPGRRLGA